MKQPHVDVSCPIDYGRKKTFYFLIDTEGYPLPNYCEDFRSSPECKACALSALDLLIQNCSPMGQDLPDCLGK